ncbi:hypothetical protein QJS10_CPB22g00240 [Acorus calamus]|uniref:Uncharacterized protein n=1 Tax=Acorus calamus TaxID=4465 RepID=A0AAV9C0M4_ACOCL|nr:hypothetical protein QJS10_CPB22g00240 [Acorus calamus]
MGTSRGAPDIAGRAVGKNWSTTWLREEAAFPDEAILKHPFQERQAGYGWPSFFIPSIVATFL